MGGLNFAGRMRVRGIPYKKGDKDRFPIDLMKVIRKGPRAHPRAHLPVDRDLVEVIKARGVPTEERRFRVREDGDEFEVIDGARRTAAGLVAQEELRRERPRQPPLEWDRADPRDEGSLWVEVEVSSCSDLDLCLERLTANVSRGLPDSPSVLAAIVRQIIHWNKGQPDKELMGRIVAAMPRGVTSAVVVALSRWDDLAPDLQARFDAGDAPLKHLPAVLDAAVDERDVLLARLIRGEGRPTATKRPRDPWGKMSTGQARRLEKSLKKRIDDDMGSAPFASGMLAGLKLRGTKGEEAVRELLRGLPASVRDLVIEARKERIK